MERKWKRHFETGQREVGLVSGRKEIEKDVEKHKREVRRQK